MEKKSFLNPSTDSSYIPDDSLITFEDEEDSDEYLPFFQKKMLSTNSLENLKDLKKQGAIFTIKDLKQKGLKIVEQKSRWRRCGAALRRYTTTIGVLGSTTILALATYYAYANKDSVNTGLRVIQNILSIIPDVKIVIGLLKDFFNCSVSSEKFIEDLIVARNKLCNSCH